MNYVGLYGIRSVPPGVRLRPGPRRQSKNGRVLPGITSPRSPEGMAPARGAALRDDSLPKRPRQIPILLTGPSGVFPPFGAVGGLLAAVYTARGSAVPDQVAALAAAYPAGSPLLKELNSAVASWSAGQDALLSRLRDLAAAVIDAA